MAILKIKLKGQDHSSFHIGDDSGFELYQLDQAYTVESPTRGDVPEQTLELDDDKIIEFQFEDNTVWLGDSETVTALFPKETKRSADGDELYLPDELESDERDRGIFKKIGIKLVKIFVKKKIIKPKMREMARKLEDKQLAFTGEDFKAVEFGVLASCSPDIELSTLSFKENSGEANLDVKSRYLLLLHGTASSTVSSFGDLKESNEWKVLMDKYTKGHLLAYQHRSLSASPLRNILHLIKALPSGIELDLLSQSRGGLLADLLARFSTDKRGFDEEEQALLQKHEREDDLNTIKEIADALEAKEIKIRSMVRVASPANGTTLASNRLNIFLNVTFNLVGLAVGHVGNPIFVIFKEFIMEAVACKDDVDVLPGLEAMNPKSPFIKAMNYQASAIEVKFPLFVVGGSSELSLSFKTLVVILGKLFFMKRNDLVVDTESMKWGARRAPGNVAVFIEKSGTINHFKYFSNADTLKAVLTALSAEAGRIPESFDLKLVDSERGILGIESGCYKRDTISKSRPILLLIPGIMGSNIGDPGKAGANDELLWINYWRFLKGELTGLAYQAGSPGTLTAHSLIKTSYGKLGDQLSRSYDIVTFQFDWRIPLKETAEEFRNTVEKLLGYNQPIKIVAHSMGGVLVRDFIVYHPGTWQKLNTSAGFRAVFLGSPLGGSYRIPYVLFGKDSLIKLLGKIDIRHSTKELLEVFCNFPGILNLLPMSNNSKHDFSDRRLWEKMRAAAGDVSWPIPSQEVLNEFAAHQENVLNAVDKIDYSNITYVAGQSGKKSFTISNLAIEDGELVFYATNAGDESVTWISGIPKDIHDKNQVYYANVTHGSLSKDTKLFAAIEDLLSYGTTKRLQNTLPKTRGEEKDFVPSETEIFDISEENVLHTILGIEEEEEKWHEEKPILVTVSHGDLKYAKYPVLAGHFEFDAILTTELAIDRQLDGELARLHGLGLYPGPIGSNQIVLNENFTKSSFKGGLIIGLGVPGELSGFALMNSVEKGVARYLTIKKGNTNVQLDETCVPTSGISVIAIANAYGGLSTESSIRAIILGVQRANKNIQSAYKGKIKGIEEIEIIEIFNDKALSILKTIKRLEVDDSKEFNVAFKEKGLNYKLGRRWRIPYENTQDWWTRISVSHELKIKDIEEVEEAMRMSIASNGASEKVEFMPANDKTLALLLQRMTLENQYSPEIAKTMFELLIPYEFKEEVKRLNNVSWILDLASAEYPWEMIQEDLDAVPLCVHTGMVRQLTTMQFRKKIARVTEESALVVGDPILDKFFPQLPGAKREAEAVVDILKKNNYQIQRLISSTASDIILKLFSRNHKIIHLAGHGVFKYGPNRSTGMVIGSDTFLTPAQIAGMSSSAELVFVNCCYLGLMDRGAEERSQYRNKFAANIGTQLINNGARAVVVAGWAVDDAAALEFSKQFYENMFEGLGFGEAVKRARKVIYKEYGSRTNTWGAFQCYGDPFYKLSEEGAWRGNDDELLVCEEVEIELQNTLESMNSNEYNHDGVLDRLDSIFEKMNSRDMLTDNIYELSANIYAGLQEYEKSCTCYEQLLKSKRSAFTLKSFERYCNTLAKFSLQQYGLKKIGLKEAVKRIDKVIVDLEGLAKHFGESAERWSLIGSANKRKMHILRDAPIEDLMKALSEAIHGYKQASQFSDYNDAYPLTNWLTLTRLHLLLQDKSGLKNIDLEARKAIQRIYNELKESESTADDFWKMAHFVNIMLAQFLMGVSEAKKEDIINEYLKLWKLAGNKGQKIAELEHFEIISSVLEKINSEAKMKADFNEIRKKLEEAL